MTAIKLIAKVIADESASAFGKMAQKTQLLMDRQKETMEKKFADDQKKLKELDVRTKTLASKALEIETRIEKNWGLHEKEIQNLKGIHFECDFFIHDSFVGT